MAIIKICILNSIKQVKQINGRLMYVTFAGKGADTTFVAPYAPHSGLLSETKDQFYTDLSEALESIKGSYFVGGDFNARQYSMRENEMDHFGNHIIDKGREALYSMGDKTKENRNLFVGFCKTHDLIAINTMFEKPARQLITYREKTTEQNGNSVKFGPPFDSTKYAQIDYFFTHCEVANAVTNATSRGEVKSFSLRITSL